MQRAYPHRQRRKHIGTISVVNKDQGNVADPDPGSGAFFSPGSRIGFYSESRILGFGSKPMFMRANDSFRGKKYLRGTNSLSSVNCTVRDQQDRRRKRKERTTNLDHRYKV
jgi:hypothetical protein